MKKITTVDHITDAYSKRILTNILGLDPMEVLEHSPKALQRATRGLTDAQLQMAPGKGKWSIAQIITHLSDAELVAAYRYRMMLSDSGTEIQRYDENKWAKSLKYEKADTRAKLRHYVALRMDNIALLKSLSAGELQRYGMHAERGKETIERLAQMMAGHDVNHVKRVAEIRTIILNTK